MYNEKTARKNRAFTSGGGGTDVDEGSLSLPPPVHADLPLGEEGQIVAVVEGTHIDHRGGSRLGGQTGDGLGTRPRFAVPEECPIRVVVACHCEHA